MRTPVPTALEKRARLRQRRQGGAVLLIVLLVLMMTTATATFAIQNAGFELRAAGGIKQAAIARNLAESSATATIGVIDECAAAGCPQLQGGLQQITSQIAPKLGWPSSDPSLMLMDATSFSGTSFPNAQLTTMDQPIYSVIESWSGLPSPNGGTRTIFVITGVGDYAPPSDYQSATDFRSTHETISVSRGYYDMRLARNGNQGGSSTAGYR